jgi:ATP-dependent Lon protease
VRSLEARVRAEVPGGPARDAAEGELRRLDALTAATRDYQDALTYVRWILDLPWKAASRPPLDLERARRLLDQHHYGLTEVKERVLEYLAVLARGRPLGPALCLVGPPGVGKSTLSRAVSEAAGRPFVRVSVAGLDEEEQIKGTARNQAGAGPGKILQALKLARARDPVLVIDELDKVDRDEGVAAASALLEVLDPELHAAFTDAYLEVPFDLSGVFFLTTANLVHDVPRTLRDRMEVVSMPGYTLDEKFQIARRHLLPRAIRGAGFDDGEVTLTDGALQRVLQAYTLEAGVRALERMLARAARRLALLKATGRPWPARVDVAHVEELLGPSLYEEDVLSREPAVGVAAGLAWTADGGVVQLIEVSAMAGAGRIVVTGRLGDVMRESADLAYSWTRANAARLGFRDEDVRDLDLHVHAPEGGVRKDGPSTGVALAAAMVSVFTRRPVRADVAMTGELTLRGRVLSVGGVREKVSAAHRAGIRHILFPEGNRKDVEALSSDLRKGMRFDFLAEVPQYLEIALALGSADR